MLSPIPDWRPGMKVFLGLPWSMRALGGNEAIVAAYARYLSGQGVPVCVLCNERSDQSILADLRKDKIELMELKAGDIWIRDWAPLLCERNGKTVAVKFQYPDTYAYAPVTSNKAGTILANRLGIELIESRLIWELGNFSSDGKHIIVTDQVLNANVLRNEDELRDVLVRGLDFDPTIEIYCLELDILNGALWSLFGHKLEHSICHIDGYMRFLDEQRVICQIPDVSNAYDQLTLHQKINSNPKWLKLASQYLAINKEIAARIRQLVDQLRSDGLKVFEINSPVSPDDVDALMAGADTLPDSGDYINYLRFGNKLFLPQYAGEAYAGLNKQALSKYREAGMTEIIPVNEGFINQLAQEGGVMNCASWVIN